MQILFFRGEAHIIHAATARLYREEDSELSFKPSPGPSANGHSPPVGSKKRKAGRMAGTEGNRAQSKKRRIQKAIQTRGGHGAVGSDDD